MSWEDGHWPRNEPLHLDPRANSLRSVRSPLATYEQQSVCKVRSAFTPQRARCLKNNDLHILIHERGYSWSQWREEVW